MESNNDFLENPEIASRAIGGSSNQHGNGETPVANIRYTMYRPFPATNQVLMHYRAGTNLTVTASGATRVGTMTYRLNSINDVFTTKVYASNPDPSIDDTIDTEANVPAMRNFWSHIYQYYTVTSSKLHFRIRANNQASAHALDQVDVYMHLHGVQAPPALDSSGAVIPWSYRKRFPQTVVKQLKMQPKTLANTDDHWLTFTEFYLEWYPGLIKHEVEEDDVKKTWTKIGDTPGIGEFVTFAVQRSNSSNTSGDLTFTYETSMEFDVQLKELTSQYQYIRPNTTLSLTPATINQSGGALAPTVAQVFNQIS